MSGGALSAETIKKMKTGGASQAEISYAKKTKDSMNTMDLARHRAFIKQYNPHDPWRNANNFVMHPTDYAFGPYGPTSPQAIGGMLSQLPGPVYIAGPSFSLPGAISPYVVFLG